MPKLYYPTPDQLQGARPLNENRWFHAYQPLLLQLANTDYGRDLLQIETRRKRPEPIVAIQKNMVRRYLGQAEDRHYFQSDYRVGAKWGNVIRSRWLDVQKALDQVNLRDLLALPRYTLVGSRRLALVAGGTVTTVFPDPDPETATVDGFIVRTNATSWANARDGAGVTASPSTNPDVLQAEKDGTVWHMSRCALLFDAASIPDGDDVNSGILSMYRDTADASNDTEATNKANGSIVSSAPASNTNLVTGDYAIANWGSTKFATDIALGTLITPTGYKDWTLNADGLANISKTTVSKFGLRGSNDVGNLEPTARSFVYLRLAEAVDTTTDPKLAVTHTTPAAAFIPRVMFF